MLTSQEQLHIIAQYEKLARQQPFKTAVIDDSGELTYPQLVEAIHAVAAALAEQGVVPGDRVSTAMAPSAAHLVLILGVMAAGAVPAPLNIRLTAAEFAPFLAPIKPVLIVADATYRPVVANLGFPIAVLGDAESPGSMRDRMYPLWSEQAPPTERRESDFALIIPTGGTTGIPKGAVSSHRGLYLWMASCTLNGSRVRDDVELFFSPFFHISIATGWMATLFAGATVRILRAYSVEQSLEAIDRGATFLMGAPTMFEGLSRHSDFARINRSSVRSIGIGAMAATRDFLDGLVHDYPQARVRHGYGATEFGPVTSILHQDFQAGRLAGVGFALPGCRIRIEDDDGNELPVGAIGEIVVSCPWQVLGYWGREDETAATFTPTGVRLGDLGHADSDGWLHVAGRKKEMIISGGENVFPNEVEAALSRHPDVQMITVYGARDSYWGERVEAAVVPREGCNFDPDSLISFGRKVLGGYKLPKRVRIMSEIPLTSNAKPDRRRLQAEAEGAEAA
ncbi:acyl--CoA ligase [Novosphingobium sp. ERN07]|uniref:class I adenylate-forming enzyme family protein n=1 Tax=Novosphingobium sp. ERN07 TaxID=2726187 RepID=UPI0014578194|nr:class I adenylate-forming enzyme family protein [Novosphingobium sp. ERN07]NLR73431.1 acyl--CoA ligase [Novosphingobium sp. ERN07]